jgi:hypothetical protein
MHRTIICLLLATLACCKSSPTLPEGEGRGLVAADTDAPAGVELFQRPVWHVGDRQVLVRGGQMKLGLVVTRVDEQGYEEQDEGSGLRLRRDLDLANLADLPPAAEGDQPLHVVAPRDLRFHWPLWVGKRWRCNFVDKNVNGAAIPLEVSYEVEGIDTVRVPAGTYRCLRVLRIARPTVEGHWLEKASVIWYSPEAGLEVRQLVDGYLVELAERTQAGAAGKG